MRRNRWPEKDSRRLWSDDREGAADCQGPKRNRGPSPISALRLRGVADRLIPLTVCANTQMSLQMIYSRSSLIYAYPRLFQKASTKILLYLIAIGHTVTPRSNAPLLNMTQYSLFTQHPSGKMRSGLRPGVVACSLILYGGKSGRAGKEGRKGRIEKERGLSTPQPLTAKTTQVLLRAS